MALAFNLKNAPSFWQNYFNFMRGNKLVKGGIYKLLVVAILHVIRSIVSHFRNLCWALELLLSFCGAGDWLEV